MSARVRAEPYRVFFPLGALLGAIGVGAWLPFVTGMGGRYMGVFHAITQTQAFLLAFAIGFLLTAIPKRTASAPASSTYLITLALLVCAVPLATALGALVVGQAAYVLALLLLAVFALRRFLGGIAGRRPPASFVLVPMAIAAGVVGAVLFAAGSARGGYPLALALGRALSFEGVFTCLVLGIGAFFLPLALRGEAAADVSATPGALFAVGGYVAAGLLVFGGLVIEALGSLSAGALLRGSVALAVLLASGAWRRPTRPGINRRLLWLAPWTLPLGLLLAGALPAHAVAAKHIAFVGGFGLLACSVATHVALAHGCLHTEQDGRPWLIAVFGSLFVLAMVVRSLATLLIAYYQYLLFAAAIAWLLGIIAWLAYLTPRMVTVPLGPSEEAP